MRLWSGAALFLGTLAASGGPVAQDAQQPETQSDEPTTLIEPTVSQTVLPRDQAVTRLPPDMLRDLLQRPVADTVADNAGADDTPDSGAIEAARLDLDQMRAQLAPEARIQVFKNGMSGERVDARTQTLDVKPGDLLTVHDPGASPTVRHTNGVKTAASPTRLLLVEEDGGLRDLHMVHLSEGLGWRSESGRFEGALLIGVVDRNNPGYSGPLAGRSIPVQLMTRAGELSDDSLALQRIGQPYQKVGIMVDFPADPFRVRLISQLDEQLPHAELPVTRPELVISAPDELIGMGIGSGTVLVSGKNTRLSPGNELALTLSRGWPDAMTLKADPDGIARGTIRSDWVGAGTLGLAPNGVYRAEPVTVIYRVPIRFLISSVLGAMLGALVFVYRRKRAGDRSRGVLLFDWLIGALIGAVVPLLAYTGFRLPQWLPTPEVMNGEAVPFALAFLAAAAGTAVIDGFSGRGRAAPG